MESHQDYNVNLESNGAYISLTYFEEGYINFNNIWVPKNLRGRGRNGIGASLISQAEAIIKNDFKGLRHSILINGILAPHDYKHETGAPVIYQPDSPEYMRTMRFFTRNGYRIEEVMEEGNPVHKINKWIRIDWLGIFIR